MSDRPHDMDPRNDPPHDDSRGGPPATVRSDEARSQGTPVGGAASTSDAAARSDQRAADPRGSQLDPANEKDLWSGRMSKRAVYPAVLLCLLLTVGVLVAAGALWTWRYSWRILALSAVLLVVLLVRHAYRVLATHYKLTSQRLFIRRGVFSQTVDQTELLRVDDVKFRQSLIDRLLGIGTVETVSSDETDANLSIRNVENPEAIAEHIRRHTRLLQRRTLFMEQL